MNIMHDGNREKYAKLKFKKIKIIFFITRVVQMAINYI